VSAGATAAHLWPHTDFRMFFVMAHLDTLVVPGWGGSGPDHWQARWVQNHPRSRLVEQRDWDQPNRDDWIATLGAEGRFAPQLVR
jgi:predicted alpha/beta hydrolase family esterase